MDDIKSGIQTDKKIKEILDRKDAIKIAINIAGQGDTVVITGKGSENSMAVAGGKKIPWSDKQIVGEALSGLTEAK